MDYAAPRRHLTKCDFVAEQIKQQIISGTYKTGDQLPTEQELCEQFSVSRITVREALKKLNMAGLVDIRQGKGTFVKSMDMTLFLRPLFQVLDFEETDVKTIYTAREYLEGGIACEAAKYRTEEELARMEQDLRDLLEAYMEEDVEKLFYFDRAFHADLARASHNNILAATLQVLSEVDTVCVKRFNRYQVTKEQCYNEHQRIYEAVAAQDSDAAREAMVYHARSSMEYLLR